MGGAVRGDASCTEAKRVFYSITSPARACARAHSGNPALRSPSVNSFALDRPLRAIHADIVKPGSISSRRATASVLTVRLDGSAEYQTGDGDQRHVPAGGFILFEDTYGKGHKSRHSPEEQTVIWISLPCGLDHS